MAETKKPVKKKSKSIFSRKLKDINKDGKRNFGDTYVGDLLGIDGKIGIQKGRPGLIASMKGARREEDKPDKKTTTKKKSTAVKTSLRPKPRPKPKPKAAPPKRTAASEGPRPQTTPFEVSPKVKPKGGSRDATDAKSNAQILRNMAKITFEEWKAMNRTERKNVGLPTNNIQMLFQGKSKFKQKPKVTPKNRRDRNKIPNSTK